MNANDLFKAVMELNLDPIKAKLMHVESGEGWSLAKANAVEKEYRRFLCLMKIYPNEDTAPLVDVDTFWHYHILDTMKYAADCEQAFGYFLHHYPYVGLRGEGDEQFRIDSGERMRTLYETTFGEAYPSMPAVTVTAGKQAIYFTGSGNTLYGRAGTVAANTAYCGGPDSQVFGRAGTVAANTAYCGGPDSQVFGRAGTVAVNTAYCGGPDSQVFARAGTVAANTAYCGGPDSQVFARAGTVAANTAYCGGPDSQVLARAGTVAANTAYCGGPDGKKIVGQTGTRAPLAA
jgi:hypothetical protein